MRIAVIGASGMAGSRIVTEAAQRGHQVMGISRSAHAVSADLPGVSFLSADATDPVAMGGIATTHDVVVLATRPAPGREDDVVAPAATVLDAALRAGSRVIVVGGASPLRSPYWPDRLVIDDERFVPPPWRSVAQASIDQFAVCAAHGANWTYVSPPALLQPGSRTRTYRRGTTELLVDSDGVSRISAEDLAIAVVDEIEEPHPDVRHFTVAY